MTQEFESRKNEGAGVKLIVNKVTKLDEKGLEIQVSEGTLSDNISPAGKVKNCIGFGLILTGMAFLGFWWTRKKII